MPSPLLSTLYTNKEQFISGQALADGLGVTRAAVWKAVESLRADGYAIESSKAKGYRLVSVPDLLTEREIPLGLMTERLGRNIVYFDSTDSTNTQAARLAHDGAPEGTLVIAETQTAGRGRLGRKWESPPGVNLYFTLILRPDIPPSDAPMITLAAAVALIKATRALFNLPAAIKWPNDMLIDFKKCAGILTEMSAEPERVRHVILGIGVDVNMERESFPEEIRDISTSIRLEKGEKADRAELLRQFLTEMESIYAYICSNQKEKVLDEWRGLSCTLGRRVTVKGLWGECAGIARDIDGSGSLLIEKDGGEVVTVMSGDLYFE
jgi:BirA family transcriptional regulator, biotin operon repressor / biotin---[acetyl-CoA-carboxylase] ligase